MRTIFGVGARLVDEHQLGGVKARLACLPTFASQGYVGPVLFGSWSAVRYNGSSTDITTAKGQVCGAYIASTGGLATKSADFSCNPDFNVSQLGVVTRWTPVKNLAFSAEVMWFHLDQKFTGTSVLTPSAPKPTTTYEYKNQDTVSLNVRVQRNF